MCQPGIVILCVRWVHGSLVAHGHDLPHSQRQPKCCCLVTFVVFMRTHPTHKYLESNGLATNIETCPYETLIYVPRIY